MILTTDQLIEELAKLPKGTPLRCSVVSDDPQLTDGIRVERSVVRIGETLDKISRPTGIAYLIIGNTYDRE